MNRITARPTMKAKPKKPALKQKPKTRPWGRKVGGVIVTGGESEIPSGDGAYVFPTKQAPLEIYFPFHRDVRAQLARIGLEPVSITEDATLGALTAAIDVIVERLKAPPAPPPPPPRTDLAEVIAPPTRRPESPKATLKLVDEPPEAEADTAPSPDPVTVTPEGHMDWRSILGIRPDETPTVQKLRNNFLMRMAVPNSGFAFKMAKIELGYLTESHE